MKNKFIIALLTLMVSSCTTSNQLISSNKIFTGMDMGAFCGAVLYTYISNDPCMGSYKYEIKTNRLILIPADKSKYYVFKSVTKVDAAGRHNKTNGFLLLVTQSYDEAKFNLANP